MKKTLFFVICSLLFLISCDKLFISVSGKEVDLQGKWQMDDADTVYYNFQNSLFQYQIYLKKDGMSQVFGYYTLYGDTALDLRLLKEYASFPLDYLGWDTLYSSTGQDTIFKVFEIIKFTNKELILHSNSGKMSFHKF
ncbi:MAG: lipocalin-like domain-containing protein [Candidatus Azobacteroides sp.]|nr:lipocalin-like domain-containing protein [Candidatus Azobacteroides sp.]